MTQTTQTKEQIARTIESANKILETEWAPGFLPNAETIEFARTIKALAAQLAEALSALDKMQDVRFQAEACRRVGARDGAG